MDTNLPESPLPSGAPLSPLAVEVQRESEEESLARGLESRTITPTPVSRGEAHSRTARPGGLKQVVLASPALAVGIAFLAGLLGGSVIFRGRE
jgi:hypothetical protein